MLLPKTEAMSFMHERAEYARLACMRLNSQVLQLAEIQAILSELLGYTIPESVRTLTPIVVAGSVVTRDVPAGYIVAVVPARVVREVKLSKALDKQH